MQLPEFLVTFLTNKYPYASELQALGMAFQGALAVRNGANKDRKMHWFHAFALTTVLGFGGGWLAFMLMGKPTSMVSGGDINVTACIIAFVVVNYTPFDIGYKLLSLLPFTIIITVFAQLFRSFGMMKFIQTAFSEINPSPYYPIPVIGPILYGTMLGNMGGLVMKGLDGYLKNGIPWPFQNGMFIGTFYHLFAHDKEGPLGNALRSAVKSIGNGALLFGLDDATYAAVVTAAFMQIAGVMMLPQFFGPTFNPITDPVTAIGQVVSRPLSVVNPFPGDKGIPDSNIVDPVKEVPTNGETNNAPSKKSKKRKKKVA